MPAISEVRRRNKRIVVVICLVVAGLHFVTGPGYSGPFPVFVNGYMIDILLPFSMFLLLGITGIDFLSSKLLRSVAVFGVGAIAETLQYVGIGIFGHTFDPWDYVMFIFGIGSAILFESTVLSVATSGSGPAAKKF
jgi:hypothetical protein